MIDAHHRVVTEFAMTMEGEYYGVRAIVFGSQKIYNGRVGVPLAFRSHSSRMCLPVTIRPMRFEENVLGGV